MATHGTGVLTLPELIIIGASNPTGSITLPMFTVEGGGGGSLSTFTIPMLIVTGSSGVSPTVQSCIIELPIPVISGSSSFGPRGVGSIILPVFTISTHSYGVSGIGSMILPTLRCLLTTPGHGIGKLILPVPIILGISSGIVSSFLGIAMNLSNFAISEYTSFPFNSMAYFDGTYLGATSSGIYVLSGNLDNASTIKAKFKTGTLDFGSDMIKHIRDIWLTKRTDGTVALNIYVDEDINTQVELRSLISKEEIHEEKIRMPLGLKGRFYTIEFKNIDGSDFDLNSLSLIVETISKAVRKRK